MSLVLGDIRNFCIIAHIDHGKTTLADRFLELTGTIEKSKLKEQTLDTLDLERERGITIKLQAVRMKFEHGGQPHVLNLIDTPGHVDFTYEVSRSMAACEGAVLVVDASQGIEAQTLSNLYLAIENGLEIVPVLNKIDLPGAEVERVRNMVCDLLGCDEEDVLLCSARTGVGVTEILHAVVERIPAPKPPKDDFLRALIFDSHYDSYKGVIPYVRIKSGVMKKGDRIKCFHSGRVHEVVDTGVFCPAPTSQAELGPGETGYFVASIKSIKDVAVGDTITHSAHPAPDPLPGYRKLKPFVFAGLYPIDGEDIHKLKDSLEKYALNDAALVYEPESSQALGFGYRCGFLGLLHLEIVQERLEREYNLGLIVTAPSVVYRVVMTDGVEKRVDNPALLPDRSRIESIFEPMVKVDIIVPADYIGPMMELITSRRGEYHDMEHLEGGRVNIHCRLPLGEIIFDFFDQLKSQSKGYASMDYTLDGEQDSDIVKMDILLNAEPVDALSMMVHRSKAHDRGKELVERLKDVIPRHMFVIPVQAAIGGKIVARETIKAMGKNVTAKCYGGDITRKRKLLEKQKEGKKRMKQIGKVEIPQEAFVSILKRAPGK